MLAVKVYIHITRLQGSYKGIGGIGKTSLGGKRGSLVGNRFV